MAAGSVLGLGVLLAGAQPASAAPYYPSHRNGVGTIRVPTRGVPQIGYWNNGRLGSRWSNDLDRDGIPNHRDRDIDGDGIRNGRDRNDYSPTYRNRRDLDRDGVRNNRDRDRDGDGRRNSRDSDPRNPRRW